MFFRIRVSVLAALLFTFLTSITVLAKGDFSFITIIGANITEPMQVTDPALMTGFFAFADFFHDKTKAPADPGAGYEITRFYMNGSVAVPFDRLHYYPDAGLVYYDGIVNGSSEYDGKWYIAKSDIKAAFEKVLPSKSPFPKFITQPQTLSLTAIAAGLVMILFLTSRLRAVPSP